MESFFIGLSYVVIALALFFSLILIQPFLKGCPFILPNPFPEGHSGLFRAMITPTKIKDIEIVNINRNMFGKPIYNIYLCVDGNKIKIFCENRWLTKDKRVVRKIRKITKEHVDDFKERMEKIKMEDKSSLDNLIERWLNSQVASNINEG